MAELDWREMFRRYVTIVHRHEGIDFLYGPGEGYDDWAAEEWAAIRALIDGQAPGEGEGVTDLSDSPSPGPHRRR